MEKRVFNKSTKTWIRVIWLKIVVVVDSGKGMWDQHWGRDQRELQC